jgi:assimilatory nitrate reductase catalytic subunit
VEQPDLEWPLILNTGRIRDQWHTMTRTSRAAMLMSQMAEPFVEIHPEDAARFDMQPAGLARVTSAHGSVVLRTIVTTHIKKGTVFVPFHWSSPFASEARVGALLTGNVDPVSGQPELKHGRVRVEPFVAFTYGFATSVARPVMAGLDYWAVARTGAGWRLELAHSDQRSFENVVNELWPDLPPTCETLAYHDRSRREHRFAVFDDEKFVAALFLSEGPTVCARHYVCDQIGNNFESAQDRLRSLAGRPPADVPDAGPIVCACFSVGRHRIADAIRGGAATLDAIGAQTCAGTNCGSCRPEIGGLLNAARIAKAS